MNRDLTARQGASPAPPLDRQGQVLKADGVVLVHGTSKLKREDQIQILAPARDKGRPPLCRSHLKAAIELGDIVLAQKAVGLLQGLDTTQSQLLRQPSLPSLEGAVAAAGRLRGV